MVLWSWNVPVQSEPVGTGQAHSRIQESVKPSKVRVKKIINLQIWIAYYIDEIRYTLIP